MLKTLPALAALVVAAVLLVPTVSQAADVSSVRVSYADLNLSNHTGQHLLQRRIVYAAKSVCDSADPRDLNFSRAVNDCRNGAIADAQPAYRAAVSNALHPSVTVLEATALVVSTH